jgi:hypothetical protein
VKIVLYTKDPRLRASPRHGGREFFLMSPIRRGGAPSGAVAIIIPDGERGNNPASYLNTTIFIGKIGSGKMHEKNLNAQQEFLAPHV